MKEKSGIVQTSKFDEFKSHLLLLSEDFDDQLDEFVWTNGEPAVSQWVAAILEQWEEIAKDLSRKQQNVLLWRIIGYPLFIGFWLQDNSKLDLPEKFLLLHAAKNVTLSLPQLFEPGEPMENGYYMWWDILAKSNSRHEIASICLDLLADLSLPQDPHVQVAALHGLGHLQHPERPAVVDEFIRRHPEFKDEPWVLQCRNGTVL